MPQFKGAYGSTALTMNVLIPMIRDSYFTLSPSTSLG
jgi:hypothetical protein